MAFGDCGADYDLVQVGSFVTFSTSEANMWHSFLLKDAQDDMAGERLKA